MRKHILGFAVFSIIIGVAAIVSALFYQPAKSVAAYEISRSSCRRNVYQAPAIPGAANVRVLQASFDTRSKQLYTSFFIKRVMPSTTAVNLELTFFTKTLKGTKFLATENVGIAPDFGVDNNASHSIVSSYQWLDELKSHDNLYVVAKATGTGLSTTSKGDIDEKNAMPILLMGNDF